MADSRTVSHSRFWIFRRHFGLKFLIDNSRYRLPLGVLGAGLILAACGGLPSGILEDASNLERAFLASNLEAGAVLFQDDFEDPTSGWPQLNDEGGAVGYAGGSYRFDIRRPDWYYWGVPELQFDDVHIETIIRKNEPDSLTLYGILCRYQDMDNFYFAFVTSDGYYGIGRLLEGREALMGMDTMQFSPAILQGAETNYLRMDCIGDRISLTVNGQPLFLARDRSFPDGKVGLIASLLDGDQGQIDVEIISIMKP